MPSTPTVLDVVTATNASGVTASATVAPAANALLIVAIQSRGASAATRLPVTIADTLSGGSLTWTKRGEPEHIGAASTATLTVWTAQTGATPGTGVITTTLTSTSNRRCQHVIQVASGFNTTTPVKQAKSGSGAATPLILTMDATPDADSLMLAFIMAGQVTAVTNDADYTELSEVSAGTNHCAQVQYDAASADATVQWADAGSTANAGTAIEIDASGAGAQTVNADAIAATTTHHQPAVTVGAVNVAANALASTTTLHQPSITTGAVSVNVNAIAATTTVHEPSITVSVTVNVNAIAATTTVHEPAVTALATINADAIANATTVHDPSVTVGAVTVEVNHLASTTTVHEPTVQQGALTVNLDAIAATTVLYEPSVTVGAVTVEVNAIASTTVVYEPSVQQGAQTVELDAIAATTTVHDPSVTVGAATVQVNAIASTLVIHQPGASVPRCLPR